ncbi:MAG: hypothetical protein KDA60_12145 [Planctomycetales bacterium]|nr:hypothetical protein [Planctomycetales bacterium]
MKMTSDTRICDTCSTENPPDATHCVRCHQVLPQNPFSSGLDVSDVGHVAVEADQSHRRMALITLMLIVTLIAVSLALFRAAPGLGILVSILAVPAVARTAVRLNIARQQGEPVTTESRLAAFGASFGIVFLAAIASCVSFVVTCFAGFFGTAAIARTGDWGDIDLPFGIGLTSGGLTAVGIGIYLMWRFWPRSSS